MSADMDLGAFEEAYGATWREPDFDALVRRFNWAYRESAGDTDSAMAAVNEVLATPMTYEAFFARMVERAA
ncbi:MAG: hypothetical protein L0323_20020 [Planctomycetes bacterium]|nr:hypothetical protein [Planctomycetota bacterium]